MRLVRRHLICLAAITLLSAGACATPPPASTSSNTSLSGESASRVAERLVGESAVEQIQSAATVWEQLDGSTEGFAENFPQSEPAMMASVRSITDDAVVLEFAPGRCLLGPLPSGPIVSTSC